MENFDRLEDILIDTYGFKKHQGDPTSAILNQNKYSFGIHQGLVAKYINSVYQNTRVMGSEINVRNIGQLSSAYDNYNVLTKRLLKMCAGRHLRSRIGARFPRIETAIIFNCQVGDTSINSLTTIL